MPKVEPHSGADVLLKNSGSTRRNYSTDPQTMKVEQLIDRLKMYTQPFELKMVVTTTEYLLSIKHNRFGFDRLTLPRPRLGGPPRNEEVYLQRQIDFMRDRLIPPGQLKKEEVKEIITYEAPELPEPPAPPKVKKTLTCPDHGNVLRPAEPGVLKCPIDGCKREARKKIPDPFNKLEGLEDTASELTKKIIASASVPSVDVGIYPQQMTTPQHMLTVNHNPAQFVQNNGRMYLRQLQPNGSYVHIDLTGISPSFSIRTSQLGPTEMGLVIYPMPAVN